MLVKLKEKLTENKIITLTKSAAPERDDRSGGAFPDCAKLTFTLSCPGEFGVCGASLSICRDGEPYHEIAFSTDDWENYSLTYDLSEEGEGLFYYYITLCRFGEDLYSSTEDNTQVTFGNEKGTPCRLLVYEKNFVTPEWFHGGIMYHIFVDRFNPSGKSPKRDDAVNEDNWFSPVYQYGENPGDPVKNDLFFGGDLWGIAEKLPYLSDMGVTVIYLSPIFKAASNHKYDTCDYTEIDSSFGGGEAFRSLLDKCRKYNIRIILDGVFNHTGDESIYFDKCRKFGNGAYNNPDSPYRDWYSFDSDGKYKCWWDIEILPKLNHNNDNCLNYFAGDDGIGAKYVKEGIGGWRLDVADELPDKFLDRFRASVKRENPDALIIGEVWENAADKIAYGHRRRYLRGRQLDSVMNYPFRTALLSFLRCGDGKNLAKELREIYSSYPKCVSDCLMNIIGTHDTERILTVLGDENYEKLSNRDLSTHRMSEREYERGKSLLKIAAALQYTVYGVPSVFYGDEAGMEGGRDPFCRGTYPWGREDHEIVAHYKRLGEIRKNKVFADGAFAVLDSGDGYLVFERKNETERIVIAANVGTTPVKLGISGTELLTGEEFSGEVSPNSAVIVRIQRDDKL